MSLFVTYRDYDRIWPSCNSRSLTSLPCQFPYYTKKLWTMPCALLLSSTSMTLWKFLRRYKTLRGIINMSGPNISDWPSRWLDPRLISHINTSNPLFYDFLVIRASKRFLTHSPRSKSLCSKYPPHERAMLGAMLPLIGYHLGKGQPGTSAVFIATNMDMSGRNV